MILKAALVTFGCISASLVLVATSVDYSLALVAAAKTYANCSELNKVYAGGVALSRTSVNLGGKTKYAPTVNAGVYRANSSKDRDHDGIACER